MLWITLLLALLIAASALGFVLWPLVSKETPLLPVEDSRVADLLARKDTALRAIKDLEFDHQVGKIGDEDYARLADRLQRQAIALLQQLERLTPDTVVLDTALEAQIAKLRRVQASNRADDVVITTAHGTAKSPNAVAVGTIHVETEKASASAVRFCTECGVKIDPSFKFCANCGASIVRMETATAE